ncbi:type III-B CRISPR module RAMP protein Cmr6 [Akkermansiaceae bacterium]|nr:type III-B CRISPR module RAMP protein Cmr6 [Akkermansiaceae bacterium]
MPIYANKEAKEFWEALPVSKRSRSLAATHFPILGENKDDKEWRKATCEQIRNAAANAAKATSHQTFLSRLVEEGAVSVFAKLEARLILNAGDGVIENGGISLDRNSGLPCIPGSAIKAAARRWAIQQLGECDSEEECAKLLAQIAITFGYGDTEWKSGRDSKYHHSHSDFWLAMVPITTPGQEHDEFRSAKWSKVSEAAANILFETLNTTPGEPDQPLARQLPNLKGCVHFIPAFPVNTAKVEIDILTPHHTNYYSNKQAVATDDENPIPIFFPTVAKGTSYQFVIQSSETTAASISHLEVAKSWLIEALTILGLGAKTNAGYGWFSIDQSAQQRADNESRKQAEAIAKEKRLATLAPEDRAQEELKELSHEDFVRIIKNLENEEPDRQKVVCLMLNRSKKAEWKDWKRAKKWKDRIPVIRRIAQTHDIELS